MRVVFDGVGKDTWEASLKSVGRRGLVISYGNASGPVTGIDLSGLAGAGSAFATRPTLYDYYIDPAERAAGAARVFEMIRTGAVKVDINQRYALADVAQASLNLGGNLWGQYLELRRDPAGLLDRVHRKDELDARILGRDCQTRRFALVEALVVAISEDVVPLDSAVRRLGLARFNDTARMISYLERQLFPGTVLRSPPLTDVEQAGH